MDKNYDLEEIIIEPKPKWMLLKIKELWDFRELFYIFVWRDLKVRYKQTILGVMWVIFQPLITAAVFSLFFGRLAKMSSGNLPYELFVFIGLVFWIYFSSALSNASNSMVEHANTIKKIYFPKEILPISAVITNFLDFCINFFILIILSLYLGYIPSKIIFVLLPVSVVIISLAASGLGLFLASFNVKYRDVRYILPFFIQLLLFLTPVIYPSSFFRPSLQYFFGFNPLTGVIENMRLVLSGRNPTDWSLVFISGTSAVFLFIGGLAYFRSTERYFADLA